MLVCLACPKQATLSHANHGSDDPHHHAGLGKAGASLGPSREHIKSFTTQLKDIVMKFSTGAYRHCRPCTATGVRSQSADEDNHNLYGDDDGKSSIFMGSISEDQASSDHGLHSKLIHEDIDSIRPHEFSSSLLASSSRFDLLPIGRSKRRHSRKKKSSSSRSTLALKQLPSHPDSYDAIEELLNAHFLREERILAEENGRISREEDQEKRADHQLLEEAQMVFSSREQHHIQEHVEDGDVHVKRSKRHVKAESAGNMEEWVAQVEPGVMITFVALPDGSNHLKRIRFSRELFSKWQAQLWWAENSDMVRELYSVSKTEAPFKSRSSTRSSSSRTSTTTSSQPQHTLQNTPVMQSRVGSCQTSPSNTPMTISMLGTNRNSSPSSSSPCIAQASSPKANSLNCLPHEMMDHHDNPLYDNPEFELCYNEGVKDTLVIPRDLWFSTLEEHLQQSQQQDHEFTGDDTASSTCELVRELKRVKFIK